MPRTPQVLNRAAFYTVMAIASLGLAAARHQPALAGEAVLLSSTTPGYAPGMIITGSDHVTLPDGASVTLLFQSGESIRLTGPFDGKLQPLQDQPSGTTASRLAELFRSGGVDASVIGGTRSVEPWLSRVDVDEADIDPTRSGTYCVTDSTNVWIMRPANDQPFALGRGGAVRRLAWPAQAARVEWPADLPIDDNSQFEIIIGGTPRSTVSFRVMPAAGPRSGLGRLAAGILLGCHYQFDSMLHRAAQSVVEPELWLTTDHGRRPAYRTGEAVTLTAMTSTDGYLYCAAAGEDGRAMPIFPAGAVDGAQVHASAALTIPGSRQPAPLRAGPDFRQVRCWLADRDMAPAVPHALVAGPAYRPSDQLMADIDQMFTHARGVRVEKSALHIDTQ